jgi:hypothetical protein
MKHLIIFLLVCFGTTAWAQKVIHHLATTDLSTLKYTVAEAPEWTALLNRSSGWFGGDGIFTIPLNISPQIY